MHADKQLVNSENWSLKYTVTKNFNSVIQRGHIKLIKSDNYDVTQDFYLK